jgi:hypothetical protein
MIANRMEYPAKLQSWGSIKKLKKIIRQCVANDWLEKDAFRSYKITTRESIGIYC